MQKRYIPIALFLALMAAIALFGYLSPTATQEIPERILLDNAAGKVVFNHQQHAVAANISCQTCHHESKEQRNDVQRCGTCHGVTFDTSFRKTHPETIKDKISCATCHHVTFASKVKWSHKEHGEDYGIDCRSCHHKDTNIEPEPQNCADCHQQQGDKEMPSLRNAVHNKCQSCHDDMFSAKVKGCVQCHTKQESRERLKKDTFKISPPYANCTTCHVGQKTQELLPNRMDAFHGQCIACHEKNGKGPFTKEQCNQCHTK